MADEKYKKNSGDKNYTWRKLPISTIRDEELDYISFLMGDNLKTAPYMFYMTMLCRCDNAGVFDIEDGVVFSRLMKTGAPEDCVKIANLFVQRHIITRVLPDDNIFIINDFEPATDDHRPAMTAEQRRQAVEKKIQNERAQKAAFIGFPKPAPQPEHRMPSAPDFPPPAPEGQQPAVNFEQARALCAQPADFSCFLNDKIQKNVATTDKIREDQREQTITNKNILNQTHTDNIRLERKEEAGQLRGSLEAPLRSPEEQTKQETPEQQEEPQKQELLQEEVHTSGGNTPEEASLKVEEEYEKAELREVAAQFFAKNSLLFNRLNDWEEIRILSERVFALKTELNPSKTILNAILNNFKKENENPKSYFFKCLLTPDFLLNQNTWSHMLQDVSQFLLTHNENRDEWDQQIKFNPEERKAIEEQMALECNEYGIDPASPTRLVELIAAKANKSQGANSG